MATERVNPLEARTWAIEQLMKLAADADDLTRLRAAELLLMSSQGPPIPTTVFEGGDCPQCSEPCDADEDGNSYCEQCHIIF